MAEIVPVVSEALESQVRDLLPSQRGFGEDLQASNVIVPIIDLTAAAEGTQLRSDLQTSLAFGSVTEFNVGNTTSTVINTPGFWRITGSVNINGANPNVQSGEIQLSDGTTTKTLYDYRKPIAASVNEFWIEAFDFTIWLRAGDSCVMVATNVTELVGNYRQIADVNGNLVNPSGYTPQ